MFVRATTIPQLDSLRLAINAAYRQDEQECVAYLLQQLNFSDQNLHQIEAIARELVAQVRNERLGKGGIDAFMYQYDLSSEEGIALMCLAEALLRIPDQATVDLLLRDKLTTPNWRSNLGKSESLFVNAATWGLMLTGKVLSEPSNESYFGNVMQRLIARTGEPVIRKAVGEAMRILGKQFIVGRTITEALKRAAKREQLGYRFSYDMLGEAARTQEDADRYFLAYQNAIETIGQSVGERNPITAPGISIKLSALYPRYEFGKWDTSVTILSERLLALAKQAKQFNMGLTVDAEEAERLEISLDIIERVIRDPALAGWDGFGLAVQAYQKRAPFVIDWLVATARSAQRKLMVRLVKGAYWDTEIKDSQIKGLEGYPVYTRKEATDTSYFVCAQKLAAASDVIYPQFATHNAHTVAVIMTLMQDRRDFEFQCLQGMGRALYDTIVESDKFGVPCRVYAPVGSHEDLLPYLVRRLLENGANTSFVNRIVDEAAPIDDLVANPAAKLAAFTAKPHPKIPLPLDIYRPVRVNSRGIDFANITEMQVLRARMDVFADQSWTAGPLIGRADAARSQRTLLEPRNHQKTVGTVEEATREDVAHALARADAAHSAWNHQPVSERAACLRRAGDLLEENRGELMALLVREAGKTLLDAIAEVREAADFCRYYAVEAETKLAAKELVGPTGEANYLQMHGRGVIVCISPWNFPLAIFMGQVVASLLAGNAVVAKPAAQTPLIGALAVKLLHQAGVPEEVLQLLPGRGSVIGDQLVEDPRVKGIVFTGSTETARHINQTLAARPGPIVPFIAETGGQNAMIVDSSALHEQVVLDVMTSAFFSAGQRCSALRVLFLQNDIADKVIKMLQGAMAQLQLGDPGVLTTDIGPVIDEAARDGLLAHVQHLKQFGKLIYQMQIPDHLQGSYFAPCAYEIDSISQLTKEEFGPILHVVRFAGDQLDEVIAGINATGFGLTLGIHTRIDATAEYIQARVNAGNAYVNRNMIGAVVGVQPFGGENLSGTGPKAGGPHYLPRLCTERTLSINTTATGGNASLLSLSAQ